MKKQCVEKHHSLSYVTPESHSALKENVYLKSDFSFFISFVLPQK